jgi:glucan phosphoethanolaminetransferase (alkaline phosphatase superfamily)
LRLRRALVGDDPRALVPLLTPTACAVVLDLALRGRVIGGFRLAAMAIWASSLLVGASLWLLPMWLAARAWGARGARAAFVALVLPLATFAYAGQALYYEVFHAYVGRDTVRVGLALRGTVLGWLVAWGSPWRFALVVVAGAALTALFARMAARVAPRVRGRPPAIAVVLFAAALVCVAVEGVDSRYLQASTPDVCFFHGLAHAWGGGARHGVSLRTPAPIARVERTTGKRRDVVLIVTESVRADVTCSAPPPGCASPFLDLAAADRLPLGRLTTEAPNTFTACAVLWTGLSPAADMRTAHSAPLLWEIARAAGYRTAYVTAQNTSYENFSAFVANAGIDRLVTPADLGGMKQEHLGAPDERACAAGLAFVEEAPGPPYFLVVHLSNTHAPYRTVDDVRPFVPDSDDPFGDVGRFQNRYRNAVRLQERTVASFVQGLRRTPHWDETVLVFVSDHGEQFLEHGAIYHNHSLYEQELRVPGWLVAGPGALTDEERAALGTFAGARTYLKDVHATIVDLFGVARAGLPYASPDARSLLRPRPPGEPFTLLATTSALWDADLPFLGALEGDRKVAGPAGAGATSFSCFDDLRHPSEYMSLAEPWCEPMAKRVVEAFARE